jgi:hypothetical protein
MDRLADEFLAGFEKSSTRDMRRDAHGNSYLPVRVGLTGPDEIPPQAQWAVLEHHIFGEGLPLTSQLLRGTFAMLEASEAEGLPVGIGWMQNGIWAGYGGLYGMIPLLRGQHEKAADILYAVANHASPLGGWVEEQSLTSAPAKLAGDQPHCWAATMFVRMAIAMLACERRDTVNLLLAVPPEWLQPGMENRLTGVHFSAGALDLSLKVSADGRSATLEAAPPAGGHFLVHTRSLAAAGFHAENAPANAAPVEIAGGTKTTLRFTR